MAGADTVGVVRDDATMATTSSAEVTQPVLDVFAQTDPWTEAEFLALPADRRVELLDGALLVSPRARLRHQRLSFRLAMVPHYLRIELDEAGPHARAYRLERDCYAQVTHAEPGQPPTLTEPITVTLDLAALAAAARPSS